MKRAAMLVFLVACGGTVNADLDGGPDADAGDVQMAIDDGVDAVLQPYDGTVGRPCSTDSDCKSPNGPGLARCSSSVFAPQDYYPTPVCILPSCGPVSDASGLHFCDGPDVSSSPGVCLPSGTSGTVCLPKCVYDSMGTTPTGCQPHDACFAFVSGPENGIGYCWAACTEDADCKNGQKCQVDEGWCVQGVLPPTKNIGDACTSSDTTLGACNCLYGSNKSGYCSSVCTIGSTTCPSGYVCDSLELRMSGYATPNAGMGGYCAVDCTADAGVCPGASVCTSVFASGPDCIPP
jgi:hypothetical protein